MNFCMWTRTQSRNEPVMDSDESASSSDAARPAATGCCRPAPALVRLALCDLLARDAGGRARVDVSRSPISAPWRRPGDGQERHLPVHGRGPEPSRYVRPQARAQPAGRPAAAAELQAGDHAHGRRAARRSWPRSGNGSSMARAGSGSPTGCRTSPPASTTSR